jgi:hypothetical protein
MLAGAAAFSDLWRARNGRKIGKVLFLARPRRLRSFARGGLFLIAACVLVSGSLPRLPAVSVLALSGLLSFLYPARRDSVLGESGVQAGWYARGFSEIEEWRLVGQHLRWRLRGEWVASVAPLELHERLRALLDPECESSLGNAGLDPQRISDSQSQAESSGGG